MKEWQEAGMKEWQETCEETKQRQENGTEIGERY